VSADPRPARLLVCDDEAAARRGIVRALERERYSFVECADGRECLAALAREPFDLVLLDLRMPGLDGRATLARIAELPAPPPVVVVTADSQLRTAIEAVKAGAADFLAKPYDIDELRLVVARTLERGDLRRENQRLRREVERLGGGGELLGDSPAMRRLLDEVAAVAPTRASVLICGETGTGKELVARRLHALSECRRGPFVPLNCAAVPEALLESELFGHRKGAFTGADRDRPGRFREAHGGTLFLDEVGDMPAAAQAKLLRVLQEQVVEPLGGGSPVKVEVRVLAATHRDLRRLCREGAFREDLYYRLRVVELAVPPLRQRGGDLLLLARAFLGAAGGRASEIDPEAAAVLARHPWPGNVRELRNAMERAAIFCRGGRVTAGDLPAELRGGGAAAAEGAAAGGTTAGDAAAPDGIWPEGAGFAAAKERAVESFERAYLGELLRRHQGNLSRAARDAGLHRQSLQKQLRRLGLDPQAFRRPPPA
jgi:DNA-binding NtrC family response regulator